MIGVDALEVEFRQRKKAGQKQEQRRTEKQS